MNVREITPATNASLWQYFALAVPLTLVTASIIITVQSKYIFPPNTSLLKRVAWPFFLIPTMFSRKKNLPVLRT